MRSDRIFDMGIPDDECDMDGMNTPRQKPNHNRGCDNPKQAYQDCVNREVDRLMKSKAKEEEFYQVKCIAMKELLHRWVKKYAGGCKPGAWEYDHDAADLCQTTADLLKMGDPWENC